MAEIEKRKRGKYALTGGYHPAVLCVWAALQACANMLPAVALIGFGGTLTVANCLIPLSGVFFGPYAGALTAAIGQIIGMLIAPSSAWLGVFTFLLDTIKAFEAGLLARGKWKEGFALNCVGPIVYHVFFEVAKKAWIKTVMFGSVGILTCLIGGIFAKKFINHKNVVLKAISLWCCCTGGLITSCWFCDLTSLALYHTPAISIKLMAMISPFERMGFGAGAVVIGLPLLYALPKIGIHIGPEAEINEQEIDDGLEIKDDEEDVAHSQLVGADGKVEEVVEEKVEEQK